MGRRPRLNHAYSRTRPCQAAIDPPCPPRKPSDPDARYLIHGKQRFYDNAARIPHHARINPATRGKSADTILLPRRGVATEGLLSLSVDARSMSGRLSSAKCLAFDIFAIEPNPCWYFCEPRNVLGAAMLLNANREIVPAGRSGESSICPISTRTLPLKMERRLTPSARTSDRGSGYVSCRN